jgi:hypothetical protein
MIAAALHVDHQVATAQGAPGLGVGQLAVGGAGRQEVEQDRLDGDDQRSEGDQQQEEAQAEDKREHQWQ